MKFWYHCSIKYLWLTSLKNWLLSIMLYKTRLGRFNTIVTISNIGWKTEHFVEFLFECVCVCVIQFLFVLNLSTNVSAQTKEPWHFYKEYQSWIDKNPNSPALQISTECAHQEVDPAEVMKLVLKYMNISTSFIMVSSYIRGPRLN